LSIRAAASPRARKRFGQHFLHDAEVIEAILAAAAIVPGDRVVEIGPGRGALTARLLEAAGTLDVIELDRDLAAHLRTQYATRPCLRIHEADALDFDFGALAAGRGGRLRIIGNLPYNISTPLIFRLLDFAPVISELLVMLQREVIERMAAQPGDAAYGRLSVMLAPWMMVEPLFDVPPEAFVPRPKVWSTIARITMAHDPAFALHAGFAAVVAAAFSHRRKTIRNGLRGLVSGEQIAAAGIDAGARPETLSAEDFNRIAGTLD